MDILSKKSNTTQKIEYDPLSKVPLSQARGLLNAHFLRDLCVAMYCESVVMTLVQTGHSTLLSYLFSPSQLSSCCFNAAALRERHLGHRP